MTQRRRVLWFGLVAVGLGGLLMAGDRGLAGGDKDAKKNVQAIANAVQKGDEAEAKKLADKFAAKDDDPVFNSMVTMKPRDDKVMGFGVGKPGDKVQPDGIEDMVRELAKGGAKDVLKNNKAALEEMANRISAIAHITQTKQALEGKKTPNVWKGFSAKMVEYAQDFNKAVKAGNASDVQKVASKLDANCNQCHEKYR